MERRDFMQKSALLGAGAVMLSSIHCQPQRLPGPLTGKKVLFVYGGWEGHKPAECRDIYVPWLEEQGAQVLAADSLDVYEDASVMKDLDLIIQTWTMGKISDAQLNGLLNAIRQGTGMASWHGGLLDAFRDRPEIGYLAGGRFAAHPGNFVTHTIHPVDQEDPVTAGLEPFTINTEQYYLCVDPNNKVLATTRFSGESDGWIEGMVMPVVWKRMFGKGRVFISAIGHKIEDHHVPGVWTMMTRGILWAAQSRTLGPEDLLRPVYST